MNPVIRAYQLLFHVALFGAGSVRKPDLLKPKRVRRAPAATAPPVR
jgi:hypothetical protein